MAVEVRGVCPLLQVYDMPTSVRFYRDTLGFEVVATSPTSAVKISFTGASSGSAAPK